MSISAETKHLRNMDGIPDLLTWCVFHCSVHIDEAGACGGKIMTVIRNTGFHTGTGIPLPPPPKKFENYDVIFASTATIGYTTQ